MASRQVEPIDAQAQLEGIGQEHREALGIFWRAAAMAKVELNEQSGHEILQYIFEGQDWEEISREPELDQEAARRYLLRTGFILFSGAFTTAIAMRKNMMNDPNPGSRPQGRVTISSHLMTPDMHRVRESELDDHMRMHLDERHLAMKLVEGAINWEWKDSMQAVLDHSEKYGLQSTISVTIDMFHLFAEAGGDDVIAGDD